MRIHNLGAECGPCAKKEDHSVMEEKVIIDEAIGESIEYDDGVEPTEEDIAAAEATVGEEE